MALRKSGNATVRLQYDDAKQGYVCHVSVYGRNRSIHKTILVGTPAHLTQAVDSPRAYDDAARAAIAFAVDEGLESYPDYDAAGTRIVFRRSR